jgi:hypothetical protein
MSMHTPVRKETAGEENEVLSVSAGAGTRKHFPDPAAIADAPHRPSRWQRFVNALCKARMWSARREIERHADAVLFWRRGLAERGAHLRPVADPNTMAGRKTSADG